MSLFTTVVELAKIGNIGIGLAIFVLGFMLVRQSEPMDAATAKLRTTYLWIGFGFAVITAVMTLAPLYLNKGAVSARLSFSPDFESQKLQPPKVLLPDGTETKHNGRFDLKEGEGTQVVTVAMDGTLDQVRNLRQTSANLTNAVSRMTKQRDALAAKAATVKQTPEDTPKTPALEFLQENSTNFFTIQSDVIKSLQLGDYAKANELSGRLQSSVNAAQPAVAVIAKQPTDPE